MNTFLKTIFLVSALGLVACTSNVRPEAGMTGAYVNSGEKFSQITVGMSDSVAEDTRKQVRINELKLDENLRSELAKRGLFDQSAANTIKITVNKLHIRSAGLAIMFGVMAGTDNMEGTVALYDGAGKQKASFVINASYSLGGLAGGANSVRLGWLSGKFAELAADAIQGKK